jgi:hypothetical protein
MAFELWGKSGKKMIPIMAQGKAAYAAFAAEQERLGAIMSDKTVGALDDMGDSLGVLGKQTKVTIAKGLSGMVPVLMPIIKQMQEWIATNKDLISGAITDTLTEIANALKEVNWVEVIKGIRDTIKSIGAFITQIGGLKTVLIAIGVLMLAGPVSAIFTMIGAISRLGMVLVASPIGLILAGLAAAGYLIYMNWEKLAPTFGVLLDAVAALGGEFLNLWNVLEPVLMPVLKWVGGFLGGAFIIILRAVVDSIGAIVQVLSTVIGMLAKVASFVVPDSVKGMMDGNISVSQTQSTSPLARSGALSMASGRQQLNGEMVVRFDNAPPGMRVSPGTTNQSGVSMNPDVGYRSLGAGFAG